MGSGPYKSTEVTEAENYSRESLQDSSTSFSVVNLHGANSAGGALFVVAIIALACLGYGLAKYRDYLRKVRHRATTTLDIAKAACTV